MAGPPPDPQTRNPRTSAPVPPGETPAAARRRPAATARSAGRQDRRALGGAAGRAAARLSAGQRMDGSADPGLGCPQREAAADARPKHDREPSMPILRRSLLAATAATALAAPRLAAAQGAAAWPNGTIRIVSPFPPGGSTDALARLLQPHLQRAFGVTVVVENRAGASGSLGTASVARAQPDGNSWVLVFDTHAVNPALIQTMGFDTQKDLAPVMLFGTAPMIVCAHHTRPWQRMEAVVAAAKARPETVTYGSVGNGSLAHLTMELAQRAGGFRVVHVPYRGGGPIQTAAVAGEVDLAVATPAVLYQHVAAGTLRALAQTGGTRSATLPEVPTLAESGIPGIDARAFWGFLGTGGTQAPVVARMEAALREALEVPEVRARFAALRIDIAAEGPAAFGAFLDRQIETWGRVVRENGIRPD